ncbi:transporter substrate-binding domain-containing protein [Desulfatirhabdium butyrativorans]|uniref:transporter substrate-binding domain-containing protein n=1 Tax=Desulfatirhabdium butyrativorans TaxID=340467 RepID=UPI0003F89F86|nr:transporter substrate-binding domain-containing protein [Desulfatirhabdium butyrativorans]
MKHVLTVVFAACVIVSTGLYATPAEAAIPVRTITFYGDVDYPPYCFLDDSGNAAGFDIDLIQAIARETDIEVHLRLSAWSDALQSMLSGGIGKVSAMFHSDLRATKLDFAEPHALVGHSMFVRRGSSIVSMQDCIDKAILVQQDDVMHLRLSNIQMTKRLYPEARVADAIHLLSGQTQYDVAILPKAQAMFFIYKLGISNVVPVGETIEMRKYGFAVPKGDPDLVAKIDEGLRKLKENGTFEALRGKWFGVYERQDTYERLKRMVLWGGTGFLILAAIIALWIVQLHRALQKRTAELENSRKQLSDMIQHSHVALIVLNEDRTIRAINQSAIEMTRSDCTRAQPGHSIAQYWQALSGNAEQVSGLTAEWESVFESLSQDTVSRTILKTLTIQTASGSERHLEIECSRFACWHVLSLSDITDRIAAQNSLKKSEEKFATVFRLCPDGLVISRMADGCFLDINESLLRMFRYAENEIRGHTSLEKGLWVEPEQRKLWIHEISIRGEVNHFVTRFRAADDTILDVALSSRLMTIDGVPCILSVIRDITAYLREERENLDLKEKLAQSQKMEALGLLAGTVAHDLNNILSGVVTYPELLLMQLSTENPLHKAIRKIHDSGKRAAAVVNDLLTVARGVATEKHVFCLNSIVKDYLQSAECFDLRMRYPAVHFLSDIPEESSPMVMASDVHIRKAVMNLVVNAAEAIQERKTNGIVKVSTRTVRLKEPLQGYQLLTPGEYAVVRVSDTGCGISQTDLQRIFEPFYTRKVMGKSGTGLGLTVVWNTVSDHQGGIDVQSGPDGTWFDLYFPVHHAEEPACIQQPSDETVRFGQGERILVVDDEEDQRLIVRSMLERLGYHVETAESGQQALAFLANGPVDLVVLDMIMPSGMNGRETYRCIQELRPGLRTIIASGYAQNEDVKATLEAGAAAFIQKPYSLAAMASTLRQVLSENTPCAACF